MQENNAELLREKKALIEKCEALAMMLQKSNMEILRLRMELEDIKKKK